MPFVHGLLEFHTLVQTLLILVIVLQSETLHALRVETKVKRSPFNEFELRFFPYTQSLHPKRGSCMHILDQRRYDTVDLYSGVNSNDLLRLAFQARDQIAAFLYAQ